MQVLHALQSHLHKAFLGSGVAHDHDGGAMPAPGSAAQALPGAVQEAACKLQCSHEQVG